MVDGWCDCFCYIGQEDKMVDLTKKPKTYEFTIVQQCKYTVQGDGRSPLEAEQDAIERFHRLKKSGELVADTVTKPVVVKRKG